MLVIYLVRSAAILILLLCVTEEMCQAVTITVVRVYRFVLWRNGELSNPGIQQIAETGAGDNFMEEVEACGASCGPGEGFPCMPFSGVCESSGEVRLVAAYPYLSAANMVAPSPDWCVPTSQHARAPDNTLPDIHSFGSVTCVCKRSMEGSRYTQ